MFERRSRLSRRRPQVPHPRIEPPIRTRRPRRQPVLLPSHRLVQLDKEPYQVQVAIKEAAVTAAETDLAAAQAQVRGQVAQTRANRFKLEHAIEDVNTQIANLRASVATLKSRRATLELARNNLR